MRNRCILFLSFALLQLLLIFPLQALAQLNRHGYPFIRNYLSKEYQAPGLNLDMVMDSRGLMYFSNFSSGVLQYDGVSWNRIEVANHSQCISLAVDSNDVVYVGATGEFGFIAPDKLGNSTYHSLTHLIDTSKVHFTSVRKTYATPNGVYFCSFSHIFHFQFPDQMKVIELPKEAFFSYYIDNLIVNSFYKKGLLEVRDGITVTIPGVECLIDQEVRVMLPFQRNNWLMVTDKGLYTYSTEKKQTHMLSSVPEYKKANSILSNSWVYNGCTLDEQGFAFATIDNGIYISNENLSINSAITSQTRLQSASVADVFYNSSQGVLWATLDNGISRVELGSPFRIFGKESNLNGTVLSAVRHNGTLYVGTLSGLQYLTFNENEMPIFKEIDELKGKFVYSLVTVPLGNGSSKLVAMAGEDFYEINGNRVIPLNAMSSGFAAHVSALNVGTFYAGCALGIRRVSWVNGKWRVKVIPNSGKDVRSIVEDINGEIWASTSINGIIRVNADDEVTVFTTRDGLPSNSDLRVFYYQPNDGILAASREGLYQFNRDKNTFEPSTFLNLPENYKNNILNGLHSGFDGSVWVIRNDRILKTSLAENGFEIDSVTFKRLPDMSVESFYNESDGITWICTSEGLISYNNNFKGDLNVPYYALIRSVTTSTDSLIFGGSHVIEKVFSTDTLHFPAMQQPASSIVKLKYRDNSLTFSLAAPYFHDESSIQFSYFLEGYNTSWSKWTGINRAVFTNLHEGSYTFRVKAKNVYGHESIESTYSFVIRPPWYRTAWAFIGYVLFAILVLVASVKFYTRKLEADKKRLEGIVAERTAEVVSQKVEIEHKNKEITDSIVYAKRIQEALLPVKSQIDIPNLEIFVYFRPKDIVSGDFYFLRQIPESNVLIATVADCTGHGVPGAFMSMLGLSFLSEMVAKPENHHSDEILNLLRLQVIASLNPKGIRYETKDGMDIALIVYNYETNTLEYSGANNPLYLIRNGELNEIKADKMPIGLHERCGELFRCEVIKPEHGDTIYMFSDGFVDQFGGEKGKKYLSKNFKEFLLSIHQKPMPEQEKLIAEESIRWRGQIEQIDDQCVMGIRFLTNINPTHA